MRIKTRLGITAAVPALMALAIGLALLFSYRSLIEAEQHARTTQALVNSVNDLNDLARSYLLYHEERPRQQFLEEQAHITKALATLPTGDAEQQDILENIRRNSELMNELFLRLVSNYERMAASGQDAVGREAEARLAGQLLAKSRDVLSNTLRFQNRVDQATIRTQTIAALLVAGLIVFAAGSLTLVSLWTMRSITTSLVALRRGTEALGAGRLDFKFAITARDELGELARTFERMMERLQAITVSRDELQRETDERRRVAAEVASLAKFPSENPNPVLRLDSEGVLLYANAGSAPLLSAWGTAVGQKAPDFWQTTVKQALVTLQNSTVNADIQDCTFSITVTPVPDQGYVNLYGRDITGRLRAEERVTLLNRELEQQAEELQQMNVQLEETLAEEQIARAEAEAGRNILESLIRHAPEVILIADAPDVNIRMVSRFAEQLTGHRAAELLGIPGPAHPFRRDIFQADGVTPIRFEDLPLVRAIQRGEVVLDFEMVLHAGDGKRLTILSSAGPIRDKAGRITGGIAAWRDITSRKEIERSRQEALYQIGRLNRDLETRARELESANRELEAFSYSISHDLRTPLAGIHGFANLLLSDQSRRCPPESIRFIELIRDNSVAMTQLVEGLLRFSRSIRQPLRKQPIDLVSLVRQVLDDLRVQQEGRRVEIVIGNLPPCQADPLLIKQVLTNLLSNALKFTRTREVARIEIASRPAEGPQAAEPGTLPPQFATTGTVYYVRDNGIGFDDEHAEKLFGVFQRLHSEDAYEGTGVGLAIVQRIIQRHGGSICAEAQVDKGATFYFTLGV